MAQKYYREIVYRYIWGQSLIQAGVAGKWNLERVDGVCWSVSGSLAESARFDQDNVIG